MFPACAPSQAGPIDVEQVDKLRQTMLVRENTVILEASNSVGAGYFGLVPNEAFWTYLAPDQQVAF